MGGLRWSPPTGDDEGGTYGGHSGHPFTARPESRDANGRDDQRSSRPTRRRDPAGTGSRGPPAPPADPTDRRPGRVRGACPRGAGRDRCAAERDGRGNVRPGHSGGRRDSYADLVTAERQIGVVVRDVIDAIGGNRELFDIEANILRGG